MLKINRFTPLKKLTDIIFRSNAALSHFFLPKYQKKNAHKILKIYVCYDHAKTVVK